MLILSRNIGESIIIGDYLVTVTGVYNGKVYLGIANRVGKSSFSMLEGKLEEETIIFENIKIKILQIRGMQVRLGITAPTEVLVLRDKLVP